MCIICQNPLKTREAILGAIDLPFCAEVSVQFRYLQLLIFRLHVGCLWCVARICLHPRSAAFLVSCAEMRSCRIQKLALYKGISASSFPVWRIAPGLLGTSLGQLVPGEPTWTGALVLGNLINKNMRDFHEDLQSEISLACREF